jgi:hypothetical protein
MTLFPSAQLVHAIAPLVVPEGTTLTISDVQSHSDLLIETDGLLIIEKDGSLTTNGNFVNRGTLTIDGVYKHTGFIFNFGKILIKCGIIDDESDFTIIGNTIRTVDCTDLKETTINDLVVPAGETLQFPQNQIVILTGDVMIFGTLINGGIIKNFATITLSGGTLRNAGEIINICANFGISKIQGFGDIQNVGIIRDTTCLPPEAVDDSYTVIEDNTLTVNAPGVLENDKDVEGVGLTASSLTDPTSGTLTMLPDDGSFIYTPNADFFGTDSFTYQKCRLLWY